MKKVVESEVIQIANEIPPSLKGNFTGILPHHGVHFCLMC